MVSTQNTLELVLDTFLLFATHRYTFFKYNSRKEQKKIVNRMYVTCTLCM
jgi:hypothetical protein